MALNFCRNYIGFDPGCENIYEKRPMYNLRTKRWIVYFFVAFEPEGKRQLFLCLIQSSNCLLREHKRLFSFPDQFFLSSRDRNGFFLVRKLYQIS